MFTMPEIQRSELNAVRQFLLSVRDEERVGGRQPALETPETPLRRRVVRHRDPQRVAVPA